MRILGINAIFHDPAAALVVDGQTVAAAEEERFSRRTHGKRPVAFAAWELPEQAMAWCLAHADIGPSDLDAVAYSYDPSLVSPDGLNGLDDPRDHLRTLYAQRAPAFLAAALPGLDPGVVRHVPHHVAHAASAGLAAPFEDCAVLVLDGRGESVSHLAGHYVAGELRILASQPLPHSLGLLDEQVTEHLGFQRSSDEYKVMALASDGRPRFLGELRPLVRTTGDGGFCTQPVDWMALTKPRRADERWTGEHADLAASVQRRLEEVLVEFAEWLHERTGEARLAMAGGVAFNCVANSVIAARGPFTDIWVQPAAGDAGTALGGALHLASAHGDHAATMPGADLGRGWADEEIEAWLRAAGLPYDRPADLAETVAAALARDEIVAWLQGRSEYGPRALGHRSLVVADDWATALVEDLAGLVSGAAGSQGCIDVPLPRDRRPVDWERSTAALEHAGWATADMACRRSVLAGVGGFDERFPRAYREDAELALRVLQAGHAIVRGCRRVTHPVRPASFFASVGAQAGNADDALVRRLHGRHWREQVGAPSGRLRRHAVVTAAGIACLLGLQRRARGIASAGFLGWAFGTAEFTAARIKPGPRTLEEITRMVLTSVLIPPVAVWHRLRGEFTSRGARPLPTQPAAVLFDRDATPVHDVQDNGDPDAVVPVDEAADAVRRLRAADIPVGVVTNQSGIGAGRLTQAEVDTVNARIDELIGPFDVWSVCPHGPADGCRCRKPRPGLVVDAARALDVPVSRVVVIGDIGSDVEAAHAAGARGILVPSPVTAPAEITATPEVVPDLDAAVRRILDSRKGEEVGR